LLHEIGRFEDFGAFKHAGLDGVGGQLDLETPLFDLLRLGDHLIQVADRLDTVVRLLEQALAHGGHDALVLPYALRDAHKGAELRRQVDILALLFDFKQGLIEVHNLNVVLLLEVEDHGNGLTDLALLELASLWRHVPLDRAYIVGFVLAVARHDDGTLELFIDGHRNFFLIGSFSHKAHPLFFESGDLLLYEFQAVVNREVLRDVVNN